MALRARKLIIGDIESGELGELQHRNAELETLVSGLKQMLDTSRHREKKLIKVLEDMGGNIVDLKLYDEEDADVGKLYDNSTFSQNFINRACWLIGLLVFQSFSSFILSSNEKLLQTHPSIVYFLTMLVGAGGNAGNQATVRVIREITVDSLDATSKRAFVLREIMMAFALSSVVGLFGFIRVILFSATISFPETVTITVALMSIVLISVILGALLPLGFQLCGIDPANSSTTIQVIMDITGVLITCLVATTLLDSAFGTYILSLIGIVG